MAASSARKPADSSYCSATGCVIAAACRRPPGSFVLALPCIRHLHATARVLTERHRRRWRRHLRVKQPAQIRRVGKRACRLHQHPRLGTVAALRRDVSEINGRGDVDVGNADRCFVDPQSALDHCLRPEEIVVPQVVRARDVDEALALQQHGVLAGSRRIRNELARKLVPNPPAPGKDTVLLQGEGFVDVTRTHDLWYNDFLGPQAVIKRGLWVDKASVGIPYIYITSAVDLADIAAQRGDSAESRKLMETARALADATDLSRLFNPQVPPPATAVPLGEDTGSGVKMTDTGKRQH